MNAKKQLVSLGYKVQITKWSDDEHSNNLKFELIDKIADRVAYLDVIDFDYIELTWNSPSNLHIIFDDISSPLGEVADKLFKISEEEDSGSTLRKNILDKMNMVDDSNILNLYYIDELNINEEHRNKQLGGLLFKCFMDYIKVDGVSELILTYPFPLEEDDEHLLHPKVVNFWHKQGFVPLYKTNPFFFYDFKKAHKFDNNLFKKLKYPEPKKQTQSEIDAIHNMFKNLKQDKI